MRAYQAPPEANAQPGPRAASGGRGAARACDVTIVAHDVGPVGGMERVLTELIAGLRAHGHEITVIARTCALPAGTHVDFHRVRGPGRPFLIAYPWFMLAGSLAVRRRRRGVVQAVGAIVLNRVDVVAVHYCHQVGPVHSSRSSRVFRAHARIVRVLKRTAERLCYRRNKRASFVCVSEGVAQEMRTHYPQLAGRVLTIHNGVDTGRFAPGACAQARDMRAALRIGRDRLVAAFVGGEWERKGLRPAIEALAQAPEWDLLVAGGGDEQSYRQLADAIGVGGAVHWLGVVAEVQIVYRVADALVFPSAYEAFPLVALEAAASGLAVLATPVSGVGELIRHGENGFLIAREPDSIATHLRALAADPALRARLGEAARRSALAFSWGEMVAGHHALCERLAAR